MASKLFTCGRLMTQRTLPKVSSSQGLSQSLLRAATIHTTQLSHDKSDGLFAPDAAVDKTGKANRWSMFVPAFVTHVCLGAPYGWSAVSGTLARECGFVASSAGDWGLSSATYPMSIMIAVGGLSAAFLGKWSMKVGTRATMTLGGALFGTAFAISGLGVSMHSLPLLYLGNFVAGVGYGCAYTPPIQALL